MKQSEQILLLATLVLTIYPGWFYNNAHIDRPEPLPYLAVGLFSLLLITPLLDKQKPISRAIGIIKDPVFYLSLTFLLFVTIQYINTGAVRMADGGQLRLVPVKFPGLPFSVNQILARRMLYWGGVAFAVIMTVRHGLVSYESRVRLLLFSVINGFALAVLGLAQQLSGSDKMFWHFDNKGDYIFSTFGYENFGGAFFTLMIALSCGLIIHYFLKKRAVGSWKVAFLLLAVLVFTASVFLTHTRFCYLELMLIFGFIGFEICRIVYKKSGKKSLICTLAAIAVCASGLLTAVLKSDHYVADDLRTLFSGTERLKYEFSTRTWQWQAAVKLWRDYPAYGTGHNSMRYVQPFYLSPEYQKYADGKGKANTHNDFLQYLSELGIVGMTLLATVILLLIAGGCARSFWQNRLLLWSFLGVALNAFHSLIDLPYRNCLIVLSSATVLAVISKGKEQTASSKGSCDSYRGTVLICLLSCSGLIYAAGIVMLPFKYGEAKKRLDQSVNQTDSALKVQILQNAESTYPFINEVRYELAKALYQLYKQEGKQAHLDEALFYTRQSLLRDPGNFEKSMLSAEVMSDAGFFWEANNALILQLEKYPQNDRVYTALKTLYQKYGDKQKIKWLENKKKNKK